MAHSDSDSSGGDDNYYTETNVLLGYASKEPSDDIISHLGGRPTWLEASAPPPTALARCKVCKDLMVLLLQLNGDLPKFFPGHERRLYVLMCRRKMCRRKEGGVRVLRGVRITEPSAKDCRRENSQARANKMPSQGQAKPATFTDIGEGLFGVKRAPSSPSTNPFSVSENTHKSTNPFSTHSNPSAPSSLPPPSVLAAKPPQIPTNTSDVPKSFASALSLNSTPQAYGPPLPPESWPPEPEHPQPYPLLYLVDADYEILDKVNEETAIPRRAMEIEEEVGSSNQREDKDVYESTIDKTFQKFADRLAQNPEQVIRYEFKGQPLLYSKSDAVGKLLGPSHSQSSKITVGSDSRSGRMPTCQNCEAGRTFEVQLTPHAITELEAEEIGLEGMDWGTIIVGVCERDCTAAGTSTGEVGYVEEWAGVQWEEIGERK